MPVIPDDCYSEGMTAPQQLEVTELLNHMKDNGKGLQKSFTAPGFIN